MNHNKLREKMYKKVSPLVEKMKANYPKELNMDGLDPALTQDIADIVTVFLNKRDGEVKKRIEGMKGNYNPNIDPPEWKEIYLHINNTIDDILELFD